MEAGGGLARGAAEPLLETYEQERIAFARQLVATTDRAFTMVTASGRVARMVRTKLMPALAPTATRLTAFRRLVFRVISQIRIEYRHSSLSAGRAGRVHGGDRLPWVELSPGVDNFAPLTSLHWQVHAYGEVHPDLQQACAELRLALHRFEWMAKMAAAGLRRDATYLIRPDGYVAWAGAATDLDQLRSYLDRNRLTIAR